MPQMQPAALNLYIYMYFFYCQDLLGLVFLGEWKRVPDREGWEVCDCSEDLCGFMLYRKIHSAPKDLMYISCKAASSWKFKTCWGSGLHLHSTSIHNVKCYTAIFYLTWLNTFLGRIFYIPENSNTLSWRGDFVWMFVLLWPENSKVTVFLICIFTSKISFHLGSIYNCLRRMIYVNAIWIQNDSCSNNYQKVSWWLSYYFKEFHYYKNYYFNMLSSIRCLRHMPCTHCMHLIFWYKF